MSSGGSLVFDLQVAEDLALGRGPYDQVHPAGGAQRGTKINLATFSSYDFSFAANPGTITAGMSITIVVNIPGASPGDFVMVSYDAVMTAFPTLLVSGYVESANQVKVVFFNPTLEFYTIPAGNVRVLLFKA